MNMMIRFHAALFLLMAGSGMAGAHDFETVKDGNKFYFNVTDKQKHTAELTYNGSISEKKPCELQGKVEIPATVIHDKVSYTVTSIGDKAFRGATQLTAVILPMGIKSIGNFAFEGCVSLQSIIFPANKVELGQGVFFKCESIKNITLGSEWTHIDLAMFQWSHQLTQLFIPAKIRQIKNMKKLTSLKSVDTDVNNNHFTTDRGLLYSKDGKTLYCCPRAYSGKLTVKEGTETIIRGALLDCTEITGVDLPATLKKMSFRETSHMKQLQLICLRMPKPIVTAYSENGKAIMLFQVANSQVVLNVAKESKNRFKDKLVDDGGNYSETHEENAIVYTLKASQLLSKKNLVGVKAL